MSTPALPSGIYLDCQATTPVDPRVFGAMSPWLSTHFGNASNPTHPHGKLAAETVENARLSIASSLGCSSEEIIFTSGTTESNNLVLRGVLSSSPCHVVSSVAEHKAILDPLKRLRRSGVSVTLLPVDHTGIVSPQQVLHALTPQTRLVSIIWANNEIGTISPITEIAQLCRDRGILFHTDAAQAVGKLPISLRDLPIDLLSFSAHKIYGPQGIGALYVRKSDPPIHITPLIEGGGQEHRLRSGTLPVHLIVGFATALDLALRDLPAESHRLLQLRESLFDRLSSRIPGIVRNSPLQNSLPGNLNLSFQDVDGNSLLTSLNGLSVSSGAACSATDPDPSHVLTAIGRSAQLAKASLRFGLGRGTTQADVEAAADIVVAAVRNLRSVSSSTHSANH